MAAPGKLKKLEKQLDRPLFEVVCDLLNEHKTIKEAAQVLDISESNLFRYVEKNNIKKVTSIEWVCETPSDLS
jgi:DNA-directed RNA polymerase specialized sigma subunit